MGLFVSCERQDSFELSASTSSDDEIYDGSHPALSLIEEISSSISDDANFRKALLTSANRQFDGDCNTLLLDFRTPQASNGLKTNASLSNGVSQEILQSVLKDDPLWQVSIYNPSGETLPSNYLDDEFQFAIIPRKIRGDVVPAVSQTGEHFVLDINEALEIPTLLVKKSETILVEPKDSDRYIARSAVKSPCLVEPVASDDYRDYYLATDLNDCYIPNPSPGPKPNPPTNEKNPDCPDSDRNRIDTREVIRRWSLTNRDQFKKINDVGFNYTLEMRVTVTFMGANGAIQTLDTRYNVRDSEVKTCKFLGACSYPWIEDNQELVIWDFEDSGNEIVYRWTELDGGTETEIDIPLTVPMIDGEGEVTNTEIATVTLTDESEDDFIGMTYVYFCEPTQNGGSEYVYADGFRFNIIQ